MESNGSQTTLVTGATGLIGRQVTKELLARKRYGLKVQVRNRQAARDNLGQSVDLGLVQMREADFTRCLDRDWQELVRDCHTVVHSAGLVHKPEAAYQEYDVLNVRATQNIAQAAAANKVHTLLFLSSSSVYGPGPFDNIDEAAPLKAKTPYAVSKLTCENWLANFKGIPRIIVLRPSLVFGEGDRGNLLSLIKEIKNNRYMHVGEGTTGKSVIDSSDLAEAIALCLETVPEGYHVFNVSNPDPVSMHDLAEAISRLLNTGRKINTVPEGFLKLGVKAAQTFLGGKSPVTPEQIEKLTTTTTCSTAKLVEATGFRPKRSLETALRAEIDWAIAQSLL